MSNTKSKSLFQQIGGMEAVNAVVTIFYEKVTADETVSHFFKDIDLKKQSQKLSNFIAYALGTPLTYEGKDMREAHAHMDITEEHFDSVAGHLVATLQELKVDPSHIEQVTEIVMSTKNDVMGVDA